MSQMSQNSCLTASTTPYLLSGISLPEAPTWTWVYQWNANKGWMRYPVPICRCTPSKAHPLVPTVIRSSVPTVPIYNPIRKCNSMTNPFTHVMRAVAWQWLSNRICSSRSCGRCFANTARPNPWYCQEPAEVPHKKLPLRTALEPLIPAVTSRNDTRKYSYIKNFTENGMKECKQRANSGCTNQRSENICRRKKENSKPKYQYGKPLTLIPAMIKHNLIKGDMASHTENALTAHKQQDNCITSYYDHGDQKAVEKFDKERLVSPTYPCRIFYKTNKDPQPEKTCEKETMTFSTTQDCIQHQYYQVPCCTCGKFHYQQQTIVCGSINRNEPPQKLAEPPQRLADKMSKTRSAESCCKCRGKPTDLRKRDVNRACINRKEPEKCSCACTCNILTPANEICDTDCPVKESCTQSEFGMIGHVDQEVTANPTVHSREVSAYSMHQTPCKDQMSMSEAMPSEEIWRWHCKGTSNPCCSCPGSPARTIEQRITRITPCMLKPFPCNKGSQTTVTGQCYSLDNSPMQRPRTPPGSTYAVMSREQYYAPPSNNRMPLPVQGPRRVCDSASRNHLRNQEAKYRNATSRGTGTGDLCDEAPVGLSGDTMPLPKQRSLADFSRPTDRVYVPAPIHPLPRYIKRNFATQPYGDIASASLPLTDAYYSNKPIGNTMSHKINRERVLLRPSPVDKIYGYDGTSTPVFMPPSSNIATHSGQICSKKCVRFRT